MKRGPGSKGLRSPISGYAQRAHNLLRPLYLKILDPPLPSKIDKMEVGKQIDNSMGLMIDILLS